MGLFSKKDKKDKYKNGQLPDEDYEDSFWNFAPMDKGEEYHSHGLTAKEILGESDSAQSKQPAPDAGASPSDRLMGRMTADREKNEDKKKADNNDAVLWDPLFYRQNPSQSKPAEVKKEADAKSSVTATAEKISEPAPLPTANAESEDKSRDIPSEDLSKEKTGSLSLTAEFDSIISNLSANIKSTIEEASPSSKGADIESAVQSEEAEIAANSSTDSQPQPESNPTPDKADVSDKDESKSSFDGSAFGRFFVNENGTPAVEKKPLYSLDSVEKILAEAEKKASINAGINVSGQQPSKEETASSDDSVIEMYPSSGKTSESHYFADEHIPNLFEDTIVSEDTLYVPNTDISSKAQSDDQPKAQIKKSKFKVEMQQDDEEDDSPAFEYNCIDDAPRILAHLKKISRITEIKFWLTVLAEIAALLFMFVLPFKLTTLPVTNLIAAAVISVINIDLLSGITGIFDSKRCLKTPLAFGMIATLLHAGYCIITAKSAVNPTPHLSVIFGLTVICYLVGLRVQNKRLFRNFKIIATKETKNAVELISNQNAANAIAGNSIDGDVLIAAGRKTANVVGFMKHSFSDYPFVKSATFCSLLSLFVGLAAFLSAIFMLKDTGLAITSFSCAVLLGCPLTVTLNATLPLWLAAKRLSFYRAVLPGHSAAEKLNDVNAVAVNASSLFPKGSVKLSGMKALSPNKLDETILYSAVLCEAANSPLAPLFRKIANTNESPKVPLSDSIKYEHKMGLSGWVNDSQLLIGNRTLMESHSIRIPSLETDRMILEKGYFPVYVARDGSACALLAVSYIPNKEITYELRRLCNSGITVLVNTNDPNVTDEMICDYFGLYSECVCVMRNSGAAAYKDSINYQESTLSCAAFGKSVCGLAGIITAANKIKSLSAVLNIIYILFSVIGAVGIALLTVMGNIGSVTTLYLAIFQAIVLLIGILPPYMSRP